MKNFTFIFFIFTLQLFYAQSVYTVEALNEPYQDIQNSTVLTTGGWDDPGLSIPVGFDFQVGNFTFNTIYIVDWSGGGLVSSSPNDTGIVPLFSPIIQDIESSYVTTSPISYVTEGNIGNRIFKLEWKNFGFFDDSTTSDFMNMQLWLYEGTNVVEYHYGPNSILNPAESFEGFSGPGVGFFTSYNMDADLFTDEAYILTGAPVNPTVVNYGAGDLGTPGSLNGAIPNGTLYRFTPQNTNSVNEFTNFDISVYPNPATQFISIENTKKFELDSIVIYDNTGKKVKQVHDITEKIDVSNLNTGIYFVKIKNRKGYLLVKSFIKK